MADRAPLPTPVKGLAIVSLLNDFASEMVYPLLPAFVTVTLGAGPVALGVLDGAADLTASTLRWWSGRRADRPGWRSPLIMVGYLLAVGLRPVIGLASQAWQVIGVRVLDRLGKGLRSPARDALFADITPAPMHGRAFGLQRTADHLGAVFGSLLAFELLRRGAPLRRVLIASAVPGVAAVLVLGIVLWLARGATEPAADRTRPEDDGSPVRRGPLFWLALLAGCRLPETLLLLRLQDLGLSIAMVPLVWAVLHVVKSASSYPAGVLTDQVGVTPALGLGAIAYAATVLGMSAGLGATAAIAVFLAHGFAGGLLEPAERAAVAQVAPSKRGRTFGSYQAMAGVGSLVTGLGYGWVYQTRGGPLALLVGALATAAVLFGWLITARVGSKGRPA